MNLLIFSPYYPPHVGGLENYTEELATHLAAKDFKITIFTPALPAGPEKISENGKIRIIRFPAFEIVNNYPAPKFWSPAFWRAWNGLEKDDFDIVISQTRFFLTSLMAFFFAKRRRKKWLHIEHGSDFVNTASKLSNGVSKFYDLTFGRLVFKFSDANIAISEAVKKFIQKFDIRDIPVIYRGLDLAAIDRAEADQELQEKYAGKIIVAFTGRLYRWKGVENSLRTVLALPAETKKKIVFLIAGDGEDYARLKKLAAPPVVMLGSVHREKVFALLKAADIYLHSSLPGGGLSTSLLEAAYCNCAIIATPNEGAAEVIKNSENGILIETPAPAIIKEKLLELAGDEEKRKRYAEKARADVAAKFLWDKNVARLIAILENKQSQ
jgi:glycosyltransferase involved in cell wall biosynthesis